MSTNFPVFTKTFHSSIYPSIDPASTVLSARGKVVLVTGGGRGIGKSIATAFGRAGARAIIILGRTTSSLEATTREISNTARSAGHQTMVRMFEADVCDVKAVSQVFKAAYDEFDSIDIVINNAGDLYLGTIEASDIDVYWNSFEINVKGTLGVMQAFVNSGLDSNGATPATFINLSTAGLTMPIMPTWSAYAAAKLATFNIAEFFAAEMEGKVRVFSIHPGRIATDMANQAGIPTFEDAELPGGFCAWLAATPEADFLQGRLLSCNWDVDELLQMQDEIQAKNLLKIRFVGLGM